MTRLHSAYLINRKEAKDVAAALKEAGYKHVSQVRCNDYISNVVSFYAGQDPDAQREVHTIILEACGFEDKAVENYGE